MQPQNTSKSRKLFILGAFAVIVIGLFLLTKAMSVGTKSSGSNGPQGTVQLNFNQVSTTDMLVRFNNQTKKTATKYTLAPGKYTLQVSKVGYHTFSDTFTLTDKSTVLINVRITPNEAPPLDEPQTLAPLLPDYIQNPQITHVEYFYDRSWAVVQFNTNEDTGLIAVVHYVDAQWQLLNEPGIVVDPSAVSTVPEAVMTYLSDNGYLLVGD